MPATPRAARRPPEARNLVGIMSAVTGERGGDPARFAVMDFGAFKPRCRRGHRAAVAAATRTDRASNRRGRLDAILARARRKRRPSAPRPLPRPIARWGFATRVSIARHRAFIAYSARLMLYARPTTENFRFDGW